MFLLISLSMSKFSSMASTNMQFSLSVLWSVIPNKMNSEFQLSSTLLQILNASHGMFYFILF